ncbi:large subunit ribosomal protein L47, partial [Tremellales sp. Uapishka_1]
MSRLPRILQWRSMHTGTRQIPHPATPSTSPSAHGHEPSTSTSTSTSSDSALTHLPSSSFPHPDIHATSTSSSRTPQFTPKARLIPHRPARTTPVALASGFPEPPSFPPSKEYLEAIQLQRDNILHEVEGAKSPKPHPLWQFFHVPSIAQIALDEKSASRPNEGSLEVTDPAENNLYSGRSWSAAELRTKSFADLHTLWYVLLKERNVLATQREERRRLGIRAENSGELITKRAFRCRKSMARIKYVLNERRLGLVAATTPHLTSAQPFVPFSGEMSSSDPFAAVDAVRGNVVVPDIYAVESEAAVADEEVAKEEVESRDEGFGGGKEAEQFVDDVTVTPEGRVEKV